MLKLFPDFPDLYNSLLKKMEEPEFASLPKPDDNRMEGKKNLECTGLFIFISMVKNDFFGGNG